MLYIVDESKETQDFFRDVFYRHSLFSEGISLFDLPQRMVNDTNSILFLPYPNRYAPTDVGRLSQLCTSYQLPLLYLHENGPIKEAFTVPLLYDEKRPIALSLIKAISGLEEQGKCRYVCLRHHGISDDLREKSTMLFGLPIHLTPKERLILRYMLYVQPEGATAEALLYFCMRPTAELTRANITTHIKQINNAFYPCFQNRIITYKSGAYRLMETILQTV